MYIFKYILRNFNFLLFLSLFSFYNLSNSFVKYPCDELADRIKIEQDWLFNIKDRLDKLIIILNEIRNDQSIQEDNITKIILEDLYFNLDDIKNKYLNSNEITYLQFMDMCNNILSLIININELLENNDIDITKYNFYNQNEHYKNYNYNLSRVLSDNLNDIEQYLHNIDLELQKRIIEMKDNIDKIMHKKKDKPFINASHNFEYNGSFNVFQMNLSGKKLNIDARGYIIGVPIIGQYKDTYNFLNRLVLILHDSNNALDNIVFNPRYDRITEILRNKFQVNSNQDLLNILKNNNVTVDISSIMLGRMISFENNNDSNKIYNLIYHFWLGQNYLDNNGNVKDYLNNDVEMGLFNTIGVDEINGNDNIPFNRIEKREISLHDYYAISPNNARFQILNNSQVSHFVSLAFYKKGDGNYNISISNFAFINSESLELYLMSVLGKSDFVSCLKDLEKEMKTIYAIGAQSDNLKNEDLDALKSWTQSLIDFIGCSK